MAKQESSEVKHMGLKEANLAKLQSFLGFSQETNVFLYVPKVFREVFPDDKSKWPVFKLKGYDGITRAKAEDDFGVMDMDSEGNIKGYKTLSGTQRINILAEGILGWKGFYDDKGNVIKHLKGSDGGTSRDSLKRLKYPLQIEISNAIQQRSVLTPEEEQGLKY